MIRNDCALLILKNCRDCMGISATEKRLESLPCIFGGVIFVRIFGVTSKHNSHPTQGTVQLRCSREKKNLDHPKALSYLDFEEVNKKS